MKKKPLIGLLAIALIGAVGVTYALFTNVETLHNYFGTKYYHVEVTEEFESPENWLPGTTTDKKVYAENTGEVEALVRIKYEEKWVAENGEELPLKQGENVAAIINFVNEEDWEQKDDGYYYYNKLLNPGEKTTTFIDSVTFNEKIKTDYECVESGNTKTCTSSGKSYDGATYTLTIIVETVQFGAYQDYWKTAVSIAEA